MKKWIIILLIIFSGAVLSVTLIALAKPTEEELEMLGRGDEISTEIRMIFLRHPDSDFRSIRTYLNDFDLLTEKEKIKGFPEFEQKTAGFCVEIYQAAGVEFRDAEKSLYKTFSPNGFKDFYDSFAYSNVLVIDRPGEITGGREADSRIIELAEARGYKLRFEAPPDALVAEGRHSLQPEAWDAWREMKMAASFDGFDIGLISAFRSVSRQREIFLYRLENDALRLTGKTISDDQIISGFGDNVLEYILRTSSIPGYSKHHTGYTIDITGYETGKSFTDFGEMEAFTWISDNNYYNAKRFGFIPSYPDGADNQGPEPEAWEYVFVGRENLLASDLLIEFLGQL